MSGNANSLRCSILQYAQEQFGAEPERPWERYPDNIVLRHVGNRKWYALFMTVRRDKLGLSGDSSVDVLNIKCGPALAGSLRSTLGILRAYHMSKTNWVTILLDGTVAEDEVIGLLNLSYDLTKPKPGKRK